MTKHIKISKEFVKMTITKRYVSFVLIFLMALIVSYVSIVGQTVFATVARKSSMVEAKNKKTDVAFLEMEYIKKTKLLTKEKAYELGLTDASDVSYAKENSEFTFDSERDHAF